MDGVETLFSMIAEQIFRNEGMAWHMSAGVEGWACAYTLGWLCSFFKSMMMNDCNTTMGINCSAESCYLLILIASKLHDLL